MGSKELPRFHEWYRIIGHHVCKICEIGGQKNGARHATTIYPIPGYTRLQYIRCTLYIGSSYNGTPNCSRVGLIDVTST